MMRMIFRTGQVYNWLEEQRLMYLSPTLPTWRRMVPVQGYGRVFRGEHGVVDIGA
jgi:hypothetical protein